MVTSMFTIPSRRQFVSVSALFLALIVALMPVQTASATQTTNFVVENYLSEEASFATHAQPARTLPTPNFTYKWTDWGYKRWITISVPNDNGAIGTIVIAGDPGRGEPGGYRLYSLRSADPSDIQGRLLANWTLSYLNYLYTPSYFDDDAMEDYADWLYDVIRTPASW